MLVLLRDVDPALLPVMRSSEPGVFHEIEDPFTRETEIFRKFGEMTSFASASFE